MKKAICVLLCVALLSGCAPGEGQGTGLFMNHQISADETGTVYLLGYHFESNNPLLAKNETNRQIFSLIYDSLYRMDEHFEATEALAAGITMESELSYTLQLKSGISFHDGKELTAEDVVNTVKFLLQNETFYQYHVRNIQDITAMGAGTVRFSLKEPAQNFKAQLIFPILDTRMLQGEDSSMNGTGKYCVKNYVQRKKIVLESNPLYFESFHPEIKRIEIQLVPDQETADYAYSGGMADVYMQNTLDHSTSAVSKSGASTIEYIGNEYGCLLFQMNQPIFRDLNVRKAILTGINRDKLITEVLFSHAVKAETPVNPASYLFHQGVASTYDTEQAKALLKQSGWESDPADGLLKKGENKEESLRFSLLINEDSVFKKQLAESIKEDMRNIGIDMTVVVKPFSQYEADYYSGNFDAVLANIQMGFDYDFTSLMMTGRTVTNFSDPMTDLIFQNIGKTHGTEKFDYYQRLQENFVQTVPHVSLYYTKNVMLNTSKLKKGLQPTAFSIYHNIENWSFHE